MLNMGFVEDVEKILTAGVPDTVQVGLAPGRMLGQRQVSVEDVEDIFKAGMPRTVDALHC